ncbi:hypothetical protein C0995_010613 [Termitomyces sp. Mi166|nr:hypothetical protein C0995_010613 [Termitomyces sp. Mi166\
MKFTRSLVFVAFALATSTIALPMREAIKIDTRADSSITESRAAASDALTNIVGRGIAESVFGFKREFEPVEELHARVIDDAEELFERSLDDKDFYTRSFSEGSNDLVQRNFWTKLKEIGKKVLGFVLRRSPETLATREASNGLVKRNFWTKLKEIGKKALSFILRRSPEETLAARDVSDGLVQRSFWSKLKEIGQKALSFILRRSPEEPSTRSEQELSMRMEEPEELFERYYDEEPMARSEDDFFYARDYEFEDEY